MKNAGPQLTSSCWQMFGFPTKKSEKSDEFERINGFASCQSCFITYSFSPSTGTRSMNGHSCVKNIGNSKITPFTTTASSSSCQMKLSNMLKTYKQVKLNHVDVNRIKNLTSAWLCHDMRSFTIVEDKGLRDLLQEFINLGKDVHFPSASRDFSFHLVFLPGARHGEFDVKNALRGADVLSDHIFQLADESRSKLRDLLRQPLEAGAICISPDLWSDSHRQISYLGLTATFIDDQFNFNSVELCCKPYTESDQSGVHLLIVSIALRHLDARGHCGRTHSLFILYL